MPQQPPHAHRAGEFSLASLFKSLSTVGTFTLLSRVLGFCRDLVYAHVFGANQFTDAFFVAFKIPNFLRRLFGEGAFATAFVPVLTEYRAREDARALQSFVDHVAGSLALVLLVVTVIGVLAAPVLVSVFALGWVWDGEHTKLALAAEMLRLTFPYLLFISLTAFAGGILNAHQRFAVPAFTPVLLNVVMIGCALWLSPHMETPIVALAWGVFIAGVLQLAFQVPFLKQMSLLPYPRPDFSDPGVRRIMRLMLPALFAVSVTQINLLLDTLLASFLVTGSISWLYYSDRLMEFPLGVLGIALATVILPNLSQRHAAQDPASFQAMVDWGLRVAVLLGAPAAVGLAVLAGPMIATLFLSDVFDANDVLMSRLSLMAYAGGLLAFILVKVLAPGYYARQDTRTPVRIGLIAMAANMALNLALIVPLKHAGLALATSLAAYLNAFLLLRGLMRNGIYHSSSGWPALLIRVLLACLAMMLVLLWWSPSTSAWLKMGLADRVWGLLAAIVLGAGAYFVVLFASGIRLRHFLGSLGRPT